MKGRPKGVLQQTRGWFPTCPRRKRKRADGLGHGEERGRTVLVFLLQSCLSWRWNGKTSTTAPHDPTHFLFDSLLPCHYLSFVSSFPSPPSSLFIFERGLSRPLLVPVLVLGLKTHIRKEGDRES